MERKRWTVRTWVDARKLVMVPGGKPYVYLGYRIRKMKEKSVLLGYSMYPFTLILTGPILLALREEWLSLSGESLYTSAYIHIYVHIFLLTWAKKFTELLLMRKKWKNSNVTQKDKHINYKTYNFWVVKAEALCQCWAICGSKRFWPVGEGSWRKGSYYNWYVLFVEKQTQADQNVLCWSVQPGDKIYLTKYWY